MPSFLSPPQSDTYFSCSKPMISRHTRQIPNPPLLLNRRFLNRGDQTDHWNSFISRRQNYPGSDGTVTDFSVKDNIASKGDPLTCGSHMLLDYKSPFDSTVVKSLKNEGMVLVGKNNLDEFGMGGTTTNSFFGPTINPKSIDDADIAGGSSGGSAAAVSADLVSISLGTDTGGSVRLPASFCGVIGFKPTYGRISRWGVVPYAQTFDTVGIISKSLSLLKKSFTILDRYDPKDITSLPIHIREKYRIHDGKRKVIGVPKELIVDSISNEIRNDWFNSLDYLRSLGHIIKMVSVPSVTNSLSAYYTLATAEAASNLSRFDGVRYGFVCSSDSEKDFILRNRTFALGSQVKRRIILGNYTLSSDSSSHYIRATNVRRKLVEEFDNIFNASNLLLEDKFHRSVEKVDSLVFPVSMTSPRKIKSFIAKERENSMASYYNDFLTVPASLAGLPSIAVPIGKSSIQIVGQFGDDDTVLNLAQEFLE